jgi:hypothetical protein
LYSSRQREFVVWCQEHYAFTSFPELVTPEKLLAFLEYNNGRASKKDPAKVIGLSSYLAYVSAVVDLYQTQVIDCYCCLDTICAYSEYTQTQ